MVGAQHRHRVRVEGHRDHAEAVLVGDLAGGAHDVLVTEVDTVEVADDHHGATQVGRDLVEGMPHAHPLRLLSGHARLGHGREL